MHCAATGAGEAVAVKVGGYLEFQTAAAGDFLIFVQFP
jgi:hypothetical protein